MAKSDDVQDEWYVTVLWMAKSDDVQDERFVTVPWKFIGIHAYTALVLPCTSATNSDNTN